MFKAVAILSSFVGASAFAPAARSVRPGALKMAFESEIGAQPPLGFFDPLGLLKDADQARFDRLRYVELKHGRIAMLAALGQLFQYFHHPMLKFESGANPLTSASDFLSQNPLGAFQILAGIVVRYNLNISHLLLVHSFFPTLLSPSRRAIVTIFVSFSRAILSNIVQSLIFNFIHPVFLYPFLSLRYE